MTRTFGHAIDWMRARVDSGQLPTGVLGVCSADGVLALEAFGTDGGRPATVDDRYALYSVTKPLTGLVIARAIERGLLTSETPLRVALPQAPAGAATLGQLLSHTSGIVDHELDGGESLRESLATALLESAPGTVRRYNNLAYEGAVAILEHATGEEFIDLFTELTDAAGAGTLSFDPADAHEIHDADLAGHDPSLVFAARHPAAGAVGSVHDLLAIGQSLLAGDSRIVAPTTLAAMQRSRTTGLPVLDEDLIKRFEDFGLAWNLPHRPGLLDHSLFGHTGWTGTQFWISRDSGLCVVALTNRLDSWRPEVGVDWDQLLNAAMSAR
ncbi:serine hydrolase domain-containing protein [Microcella alkalica]|uniref:CubicO group peptidase (Beta-lactamase class C family) n=1 Tax=Microcella alkalica TaxID=355930 RepID=A0A839EBR5_9MICO|nr:serine hydrolase domain-containing protein [Microcella alkalica]MBA8848646.1 CubicO group peptidase (beta-lactamase class C family) [Microcella alkalica]